MTSLATTIDRRRFLLSSLAFAHSLRAQEPNVNFPSEPRERLAISTYAFRTVMRSPDRESPDRPGQTPALEEFAASIPGHFGVHCIEPWSGHFESTDVEYVRHLANSFQKARVRVVNIPVDRVRHPCSADDAGIVSYETRERWVDVATLLGSPSIRIHLTENAPEACIKDNLFKLVDYARRKNVVVNLENQEGSWDEAFRIMNVIREVDSPFLRALPDFCNSQFVSDEAYALRALKVMFSHAYNISHVKDEENKNNKIYRVDVAGAFRIAKQAGYRGYFSMEWEGRGDPYEGTRHLLQLSVENLS